MYVLLDLGVRLLLVVVVGVVVGVVALAVLWWRTVVGGKEAEGLMLNEAVRDYRAYRYGLCKNAAMVLKIWTHGI